MPLGTVPLVIILFHVVNPPSDLAQFSRYLNETFTEDSSCQRLITTSTVTSSDVNSTFYDIKMTLSGLILKSLYSVANHDKQKSLVTSFSDLSPKYFFT